MASRAFAEGGRLNISTGFVVVIRSIDGYGNLFMYLEGDTLVQWLHISKYPPSLAYTLLELGLIGNDSCRDDTDRAIHWYS